ACAAGPAPAEESRGRELESLRDAIEDSRERVGVFERNERELFDRLDELDRRLGRLTDDVRRARADAREAKKAAVALEADRERRERALARTQRSMSRRAVALYKAGEVGPVRALFVSSSLRELMSRVSMLRALLATDAELVARYQRERDALARAEADLREAAIRADAAAERLRTSGAALARDREAKRVLLARVRRDRTHERHLLVSLERSALALEETVAALGTGAPRAAGLAHADFAALRGRLARPVAAPLVGEFGRVYNEEFRTETERTGVLFGAPEGASVAAVAPGQVVYADWFRGYGRLVILDHGDRYFTVYGHLQDMVVGVGMRVTAGETVGHVGDTGSLEGARLYFEVRQGSQAQDPAAWFGPRG
ncbi:MAG: peptidoglycan DD-metalloendopeptidase family protein, partial [Proteobacteria bacterium]|nr:peptidoglycan DD-metalloendopeptidase family protein [Pseudomonadota bacterium]